jgi:hypothetical protein
MVSVLGETLHFEFHRLIKSVWNKESCCFSSRRDLLLYLFIKKVINLTVGITEEWQLSTTYKHLFNICLLRLTPYVDKTVVDNQCEF